MTAAGSVYGPLVSYRRTDAGVPLPLEPFGRDSSTSFIGTRMSAFDPVTYIFLIFAFDFSPSASIAWIKLTQRRMAVNRDTNGRPRYSECNGETMTAGMLKLVHTESSLAWGGQEIRIFTELGELMKFGWSVELWAPDHADIFSRARSAGMAVEAVPFRGTFDLGSILRVLRLIRERGGDLVVTHSSVDSWVVGFATRGLRRRPAIIRTRHLSTSIRNGLSYRWFPDAVCTTSEAIRQAILRLGVPSDRVESIPTGVDLRRFQPNPDQKLAMQKKYSLPEDRPLVGGGFVIRSWKGIIDFVKIALGAPNAHFVIAGVGPSRDRMQAEADRLGVLRRMTFLGHVEPVEEIF